MQDLNGQYKKIESNPNIYVETSSWGHSRAPYDYDFCLLNNPATNTLVLCLLSLGGNNGASYATLKDSYRWTSTYCKWTPKNVSLVLRSYPLSAGTTSQYIAIDDWRTDAQDMLYVATDINFAAGDACDLENTSKSDLYSLYLNTHRICTDVTNPDCKYIFYCYCYPGNEQSCKNLFHVIVLLFF